MQTRLFVVKERSQAGTWSEPISETALFDLARSGRLLPESEIMPHPSGDSFLAQDNPALLTLFRQRGIGSVKPPAVSKHDSAQLQTVRERTAESSPELAAVAEKNTAPKIGSYQSDRLGIILCALGSSVWVYLGIVHPVPYAREIAIAAALLALAMGQWAFAKGYSYFWGAGVSLCFTPLLASVIIATTPRDQNILDERLLENGDRKRCPACAELVRSEAQLCRFCKTPF